MKNILTIVMITFSLNVTAQQNKILKNVNKANIDLNHLNYQVGNVNNTINGTAGEVDGSVKSIKGTVNSIKGFWKSAKAEIKPDAKSDATQIASNQQNAEQQTSDKQPSVQPSEAIQKATDTQSAAQTGKTVITISNCNFTILKELSTGLETNQNISKVEKSLANGTAQLVLQHSGSTDDITFFIDSKLKNRFDIQGFSEGAIVLSVKL